MRRRGPGRAPNAWNSTPFCKYLPLHVLRHPNVPVELDLRRNNVRKLAALLESRYLKGCKLQFI